MEHIRGIVLEVADGKASILTKSGDFIVCDVGYGMHMVGDEVMIGEKILPERSSADLSENRAVVSKWRSTALRYASLAAVFVAMIAGAWMYPADWLYLEINPSIEIKTNMFGKVVSYHGMNKDGETVAAEVDCFGKTIDETLDESFKVMKDGGFISEAKSNGVIIGYGSSAMEELAGKTIERFSGDNRLDATIASIPVSRQSITEAKSVGASPINVELADKAVRYNGDKVKLKREIVKIEKMKTVEIIASNKDKVRMKLDKGKRAKMPVEKIKPAIDSKKKSSPEKSTRAVAPGKKNGIDSGVSVDKRIERYNKTDGAEKRIDAEIRIKKPPHDAATDEEIDEKIQRIRSSIDATENKIREVEESDMEEAKRSAVQAF